jgi:hypothetical protein
MPDTPDSSGSPPQNGRPSERRTNLALRLLIDEMMTSIRAATQGEIWTQEERTQYEQELANIMARVRNEAVPTSPPVDAA